MSTDRPNILLLTTDQQRFDTLHAAGNPAIRTPHLDWLMDTGMYFSRCYSDCPVCVPARATIMTGRHGFTNGLTENREDIRPIDAATSLPGLLTRDGYQTKAVGKMHFAPPRCNYGFEDMEILQDYYREMARHPERGIPMDHGVGQNELDPVLSTVRESESLTRWTVDRSIDFLETRDDSRPFFLWTSFAKPHPPLDPCENYWALYRHATVPEPVIGDWCPSIADMPQGFAQDSYKLSNPHRFSGERLADIRRAYYACITQIDYNLGMLFARLRELGLIENTWIVFTSDHGEMLGDHHLGAKVVFFEGSAHVPLLVRPPGIWDDEPRRGTHVDSLVCLADLLPTVCGLTGTPVPDEARIDGLDWMKTVEGEPGREVLYGTSGKHHCVIRDHWKYMFCELGAQELLFDLREDPMEEHDLIAAAQAGDVADELRAALAAHLAALDHPASREGRLVSTGEPLSGPDVRRNAWPGLHSRHEPSDLLH